MEGVTQLLDRRHRVEERRAHPYDYEGVRARVRQGTQKLCG